MTLAEPICISLSYFAVLREQRGVAAENIETRAATAAELYQELAERYGFTLPGERVGVAINGAFRTLEHTLSANDSVVFIPPVAGG